MKIAQVALYGAFRRCSTAGRKRIVSFITEELVRLGYEVTLFASGDSNDKSPTDADVWRSARPQKSSANYEAPLTAMIEKVFVSSRIRTSFIHILEFIPSLATKRCRTPMLDLACPS